VRHGHFDEPPWKTPTTSLVSGTFLLLMIVSVSPSGVTVGLNHALNFHWSGAWVKSPSVSYPRDHVTGPDGLLDFGEEFAGCRCQYREHVKCPPHAVRRGGPGAPSP
jgi:hypothetical protein